MSYIGVQSQNQISPQFSREVINGDGSATSFTLIQDVPGFNADNIMVVVNNVIQEPVAAYTIKEDANGNPRVLDFGAGNVLSTTDECYVQHRGVGTLNMTPAAGSVNAAALQDNLRSGNVDSFTATAGQTAFTLTETPLNAQSISVFVNGIYQKPTTNFTVSGTTLTLTAGAVAGDEIDVIHHTIRTTVTHVADGSVTSGKLDTNIQVAGTLGVTGASTLTGNVTASADLSVAGNLTVSGTTTTIDTTVTTSDAMVINNAGTDVGLKINSTSTGNILQLQDGGVDKVVVADGGNTTFSGNVTFGGDIQINGGDIKDVNGAESIKITSTSSAVNELTVVNSATSNPPEIQATGDDTNIHLKLTPKGTGGVTAGSIVHATLPAGMIAPFAMVTAPSGWLVCEGQTLNSVSDTEYASLFSAIGTTWGGSGASSFNVPDLRGAFLRGTGSHGASNMANGNDFAGPSVGSFENDQLQAHEHSYTYWGWQLNTGYGGGKSYVLNDQSNMNSTITTHNGALTSGSNGTPRTGDETRPFNAGVKYCIKY